MRRSRVRAIYVLVCVLVCVFVALGATRQSAAQSVYPEKFWETATGPERSKWDAEKLTQARKYSESIGSAAVMIVQGGKVIDEWGAVDKKLVCYSMRKSLLSALYGIAVEQGKINPQSTLEQLNIDDV
ncbi:MAG TPA: hypothetical protein VGM27_26065, partial [Acidobacteriaceae bacterium]